MDNESFSKKLSRIKIEIIAASIIALIGVIYHFFYGEIAFGLGEQSMRNKDYTKAVEYYGQAINHKENFKEAFNARGLARLKMQDYKHAEEDFEDALKIDFYYSDAHYNLAETYLNMKDNKKALEELERALSINSSYIVDTKFAEIYNAQGISYYKSQQYEKALEYFDNAIKINPQLQSAYFYRGCTKKFLGFTKKDLGMSKDAIEDFTTAIDLNPDDVSAYSWRGLTYDDLQEYYLAIIDFNEAIRRNPNDFLPYTHRAYSNYHLGNYEEAIADFSNALELKPNNARATEGLNKALQALAEKKKKNQNISIDEFLNQNNDIIMEFWEYIRENPINADDILIINN